MPQKEDHPPQGPRNPKAEVKAAKAYAKATRPWYKKKRVIIPAGLVVLTIAGSAGSSGDTGSGSATGTAAAATSEKKAATSDKKAAKSEDEVAKVGQAVTNAGTTYKVTKVRTAKQIGDPDLLGARADGTFVIVDLAAHQQEGRDEDLHGEQRQAQDLGRQGVRDLRQGVMAFGDDSLMLKDIQPDLTTRGKLAFELPPSKVSGSTLVIEDLWGSDEIKVDLGL